MMFHRTFLSNEQGPSQRGIWVWPDLVQALFLSSCLQQFGEKGVERGTEKAERRAWAGSQSNAGYRATTRLMLLVSVVP